MISFNLPDPTEQERIRRGPHTYQAEGGVHGRYVRVTPTYQEYPKMMNRTPEPKLKDFIVPGRHQAEAELLLEKAKKDWDTAKQASLVHDATEEKAWLEAHEHDPVLTPGAYPKTMDHTPPPRGSDCNGVEDYREKRDAWRAQVSKSIVHDEVEEQLWLEEHQAAEGPKAKAQPKRKGRKPKAVAA